MSTISPRYHNSLAPRISRICSLDDVLSGPARWQSYDPDLDQKRTRMVERRDLVADQDASHTIIFIAANRLRWNQDVIQEKVLGKPLNERLDCRLLWISFLRH